MSDATPLPSHVPGNPADGLWQRWRERLSAPEFHLSDKSCDLYGARLSRFEQALAELGVDITTAGVEEMKKAVDSIGFTDRGREQLRAALAHGLRWAGRIDEFPRKVLGELAPVPSRKQVRGRRPTPEDDIPSRPLTVEQAQMLERTAWAVDGVERLSVLMCLHTNLPAGEIAGLRWAQLHLDAGPATLDAAGGPVPLHPRLVRALLEHQSPQANRHRSSSDYVFPGREAGTHMTRATMWSHCRYVSGLAGLGSVPLRRLRWTKAGEVDPDKVQPIVRNRYQRSEAPLDIGIGVEDLMATGLSERTAGMYLKALRRVAGLLADNGSDLATCTGRDLAAISRLYPNTHAMRSQLRGALNHGWEALGREDTPSMKALRIPPRPRGRSRALETDVARRLEQAAWDRDDMLGLAVLIGLYAALRRFEIAKLRWEDFVYGEDGMARWVRVHGKGSLVADVPIHPVLAEALARFRRDRGWLFPGRYPGRPVNPDTVWNWTRHVAAEAGLADIPTHVLRHTALTEANDASGDLRTVQEIARHSRPEMTAIYTRVTSQRMTDVVAKIDYGRRSGQEPDPADLLPGVGYRQLVTVLESERTAENWVALGLAAAPAGWRLEVTEAPGLQWVHPAEPRITALAGTDTFDLLRQAPEGKDWAEMWELPSPEQLLVLAELLVSGAPAPDPTIYLGRPDDWPDEDDDEAPQLPPGPEHGVDLAASFAGRELAAVAG